MRKNKSASMFYYNDVALRKKHKLDATYWTTCSAVVTACVWTYRYPFNMNTLVMLTSEGQVKDYPQHLMDWLPHVVELCVMFIPLFVSLFLFRVSQAIDIETREQSADTEASGSRGQLSHTVDSRAVPTILGGSTFAFGRSDTSQRVSNGATSPQRLDSFDREIMARTAPPAGVGGRVGGQGQNQEQGVGAGLRRLVQEWVPSKYLSLYNPPIINIDTPVGAPPVVDIMGPGGVGAGVDRTGSHSAYTSNNPVNYDSSMANMLLCSPTAGTVVDSVDGLQPSAGAEVVVFNSMKLTDTTKTQFMSRYQKQQGSTEEENVTLSLASPRSPSQYLHQHQGHGYSSLGQGQRQGQQAAAGSRIAYKSAPMTIDAGEDLYYQLPSSATIIATLPPGGTLASGDGLMHLTRPTSVHGYSNKPLHVTTALFGVISSAITSTNAVNLTNSLNDNTLDTQQLLAVAPPITGINTAQILDQLVTPTHLDNCKLGLGRYLRNHIISFDNCVNNIVRKLSSCVNTYTGVPMSNEQTSVLRKCLLLQLFEVPNTLSYTRPVNTTPATTSVPTTPAVGGLGGFGGFGTGTSSFSFSSGGFGTGATATAGSAGTAGAGAAGLGMGRTDPNQMDRDCTQVYQNLNFGAGTTTSASPAVASAVQVPVMLNVKDLINKLCRPVFTMEQRKFDMVGGGQQSGGVTVGGSGGSSGGLDCLAEYELLVSLFLTLLVFTGSKTAPVRSSTTLGGTGTSIGAGMPATGSRLVHLNTLSDAEMRLVKYTLVTPVDVLTADKERSAAETRIRPPEVSAVSIAYCLLYHLRALLVHNDNLVKIAWPSAPASGRGYSHGSVSGLGFGGGSSGSFSGASAGPSGMTTGKLLSDAEILMLVFRFMVDSDVYRRATSSVSSIAAGGKYRGGCGGGGREPAVRMYHNIDEALADAEIRAAESKAQSQIAGAGAVTKRQLQQFQGPTVSIVGVPGALQTPLAPSLHLYTDDVAGSGGGGFTGDASFVQLLGSIASKRTTGLAAGASILSPHYNCLLYDPSIQQYVEIVLDSHSKLLRRGSDISHNSILCIIYYMLLLYKYEISYKHSSSSSSSSGRVEFESLQQFLLDVFMVKSVSDLEDLLRQANILQQ